MDQRLKWKYPAKVLSQMKIRLWRGLFCSLDICMSLLMGKTHLAPIWCFCFTSLNWNYTQLLMFWGSFMNLGLWKPFIPEKLGIPNFLTSAAVALSCPILHGGWWISNQSTNRDLTFILLFPACHPIYPAISGGRKKKRAKCWVTLVWHKSCFVFGIIKVGSIIHQDWTKGQRAFTKQWDNGFPFNAAERLQTHTHTSCGGLQIICFEHLAYCCCCRITMQLKFWRLVHLCTWTQ